MFFTPPYIGGVFFVYPICCPPLTVHRSVLMAIQWLPSVLRAIQIASLRFLIASEWLRFINICFAPSLGQSNWLPFVSFVIRVAPLLSHWLPSVLRAIQLAAQRFKRRWIINKTQPNCSGSVTVELAEPFHCSGNWAAHCFQGYPIGCALFPLSSELLRSVLRASLRS